MCVPSHVCVVVPPGLGFPPPPPPASSRPAAPRVGAYPGWSRGGGPGWLPDLPAKRPPPPQIPLVDGVWLTNQGGARLGGLHPSAPPSSPRKGGFRVGHRFCSCVAWAMLVLCREARLGGTVPVPGRSQGIAQGASVNHPRRVPGRAPAHGGGLALPGAGGVGRPAEGPTGVGPHPWGRRASQGDPHLGGVPTRCGVTCPTPQVTLWLGAAGDADAATGQAGWLPKTAVSSGRGQPALFGGSV